MAVATATININKYPSGVDNTQHRSLIYGTIIISTGGTYPPGGFPLVWSGLEQLKVVPASSTSTTIMPVDMVVKSSSNPPSGYVYAWDSVLGNLHIYEAANSASGNSGPLLEVGGNLDNRIVADIISFKAEFIRN
jgi:hypothetical protein